MTTQTSATVGTWNIDPSHAEVGFTVRHLMSKVRGKFETFESTLITAESISDSTVEVSVDLSSVNTGNAERDNHLRSSDFFNVESSPKMTFVSTGIEVAGDNELLVNGDLTIKDTTKPVQLKSELLGEGTDPWGGSRLGIEATGEISRKEFGIDFNIPVQGDRALIGDKINITIHAEFVLQA